MKKIVTIAVVSAGLFVIAQLGLNKWTTLDARNGFDVESVVTESSRDGLTVALVRSDSAFKQIGGANYGLFQLAFIQQKKGDVVAANRWFLQIPYAAWKPL